MSIIKVKTGGITADAITDALIADDVVGTEHLTANEVDTTALGADAVTGAQLADNAVNSEHYTDGSVDTAHIADAQITTAKLSTAVFTGATDIGAAIVDADLFLMDDGAGGTIRKTTASRLKTYAGGKVLQIKYAFNTAAHSTTSTSYSTIETVDITPTKAGSVIKLIFSGRSYTTVTSREHYGSFYRDSTALEQFTGQWSTSGATAQREIFEFYDSSHNTTSQITYSFQHKSGNSGDAMIFSPNGAADGGVYLTAMEFDT